MEVIKKFVHRKSDGKVITLYFLKEGVYREIPIRPVFEADYGILDYLSRFIDTGVRRNDKVTIQDSEVSNSQETKKR